MKGREGSRVTDLCLSDWTLTLIKRRNTRGGTSLRESVIGFILGHAEFEMPGGLPTRAGSEMVQGLEWKL